METSAQDDRMIAPCGLICSECTAYIATQANNEEAIAATAKEWTHIYNTDIKPKDVWCDGCMTDGRKSTHCGVCEIRACILERSMANCGLCSEFNGCDKIQRLFEAAPKASKVLIEINKPQ